MLGAREVYFDKVISDLLEDLSNKKCAFLITGVFNFVLVTILIYCKIDLFCITANMQNANITILGVDIAGLSILFALFQNTDMDINAKKAFHSQSIAFIGNAIFQLTAFLLCLFIPVFNIFCSACVYFVLFIQLWSLLLVFDLIIELYTLITAISNKK